MASAIRVRDAQSTERIAGGRSAIGSAAVRAMLSSLNALTSVIRLATQASSIARARCLLGGRWWVARRATHQGRLRPMG